MLENLTSRKGFERSFQTSVFSGRTISSAHPPTFVCIPIPRWNIVATFRGHECATRLYYLLRGEAARYQRYDWETDRLNQWIVVKSNPIILVEGVFSSRPELRAFTDLAIFVDTPREERLRRMRARGHLVRDPENNWLLPWMAVEDWYLSTVRPTKYVQMTLQGF